MRSERFDLVVIGGGITGAGVALDAASRGYSVALVEKADFASGTSSRSSKLVHGGLRYLQNFDLGLVREALLERQLLVKLAPHLVRPLQMVVAAFDGARPDRLVGIGLNMYDVMAAPGLRGRRSRRAAQAGSRSGRSDPEESDSDWSPARHRTISGEDVVELLSEEAETCGVRVRDGVSGEQLDVRADNVVNATGVWADQIRPEELHSEAEVPKIVPSRGTHITVALEDLPLRAGAIVPAGEGRSIFALPWLGRALLGTTDNTYEGDIDHVRPSSEDVAYLLEATNAFFGSELGEGEITGAYAGVRPLISSGDSRKSVDISRKAELYETSSGLITITGGKLTTWRRMAKLVVDRLVEREGIQAPCRTHEIPLGQPATPEELPEVDGVGAEQREALAARYGHAAEQVLALAAEHPGLASAIVPGRPDLLAECTFAAIHEQALSVGDVLLRRTRLGLLAGRELCRADSPVPGQVAEALAGPLRWSQGQAVEEVKRFHAEATAEGIALD